MAMQLNLSILFALVLFSWFFVERMLDESVDSESTGSSDTEESDKSVDSAELDEMYEQDGDFAEMEAQDVDQGDDNDCN